MCTDSAFFHYYFLLTIFPHKFLAKPRVQSNWRFYLSQRNPCHKRKLLKWSTFFSQSELTWVFDSLIPTFPPFFTPFYHLPLLWQNLAWCSKDWHFGSSFWKNDYVANGWWKKSFFQGKIREFSWGKSLVSWKISSYCHWYAWLWSSHRHSLQNPFSAPWPCQSPWAD